MYWVIGLKKQYILIALLFFFFVFGTYYASSYEGYKNVQQVFNIADLKANCKIKEIKENDKNYEVTIYYPETSYINLNHIIEEKMNYYIDYFKTQTQQLCPLEGRKFELQITFSSNEYEDYISYVFDVFEDYGGAHPSITTWTISYNIKEEKIVDIKYLVDKNKDFLNILSSESFNMLKENEVIKEAKIEEMLINGTKPKEENFSDFAFTQDGFKVFFEIYSIAPYALGDFVVVIPYDKLNV